MKTHVPPQTVRVMSALGLALPALLAHAAPQAITVLDAEGRPVPRAAVSVMVKGARPAAPAGTTAQLAQRGKAFEPALLVIQTGTAVLFPNFDTVRHHVYSFSPTKPFEIKLYAGTPATPVLFDKPGIATLGCNIHDRMLAYVDVVETPYFGVTDAQGQLALDLPAGEHRARIWIPSFGEGNLGADLPLAAPAAPGTLALRLPKP